jgi:tetratricopeptide (TPR) repeat protein
MLKLYDQARVSLVKSIELNPYYAGSYYDLGMVYAMQKNYNDAIIQWKKVLNIDPDNLSAKENIERAKKILGK